MVSKSLITSPPPSSHTPPPPRLPTPLPCILQSHSVFSPLLCQAEVFFYRYYQRFRMQNIDSGTGRGGSFVFHHLSLCILLLHISSLDYFFVKIFLTFHVFLFSWLHVRPFCDIRMWRTVRWSVWRTPWRAMYRWGSLCSGTVCFFSGFISASLYVVIFQRPSGGGGVHRIPGETFRYHRGTGQNCQERHWSDRRVQKRLCRAETTQNAVRKNRPSKSDRVGRGPTSQGKQIRRFRQKDSSQSINQSIEQAINQSINQSNKRSINQSIEQATINQLIEQAINQLNHWSKAILEDSRWVIF